MFSNACALQVKARNQIECPLETGAVSKDKCGAVFRAPLKFARWKCAVALICMVAALCVTVSAAGSNVSLLTYNVGGNGATDWSTNAPQVQAIGRQMIYLKPDIVTFQEIPFEHSNAMTDFIKAYLPGYTLAMNSGTDGFVRSVIASRFPVARSQKWLDGVSLTNFGYNGRFARDLFEAEVRPPGFSEPLHVFTTHLKAESDTDSAARRGAEASAISNFFVTVFLPANGRRPYALTGDLNEDINHPPSTSRSPVQRLVNSATGLRLTTPLNTVTGSDRTYSPRTALTVRLDYILPGDLLYSNIVSSQVFRTDVLSPLPTAIQRGDSAVASDHLPVLMVFRNPYETPFRIVSFTVGNGIATVTWEAQPNRLYVVEGAPALGDWTAVSPVLTASDSVGVWSVSTAPVQQFIRVRGYP